MLTHLAIVERDDRPSSLDGPAQDPLLVMFGTHADEATSGQVKDEVRLLRQFEFGADKVDPSDNGFAAGVAKKVRDVENVLYAVQRGRRTCRSNLLVAEARCDVESPPWVAVCASRSGCTGSSSSPTSPEAFRRYTWRGTCESVYDGRERTRREEARERECRSVKDAFFSRDGRRAMSVVPSRRLRWQRRGSNPRRRGMRCRATTST